MYLAFLFSAVVALLGYRARALSLSGAIAACVVGGTILGFGGWAWALLLGLFFASSSVLSFFKGSDTRKKQAAETFDKGGTRDAAQVLANGGVATLLALAAYFAPASLAALFFCAYTGSLAAATADTWATEIGTLSLRQPRMITTLRPVAPGTSGGVTWLGSGASVAGALVMGGVAAIMAFTVPSVFGPQLALQAHAAAIFVGGLAGGTLGALTDSTLGATIQGSYFCPLCNKPTESRVHKCGTETRLVRGMGWVTNDVVNLAATVAGAIFGGAVCALLYN